MGKWMYAYGLRKKNGKLQRLKFTRMRSWVWATRALEPVRIRPDTGRALGEWLTLAGTGRYVSRLSGRLGCLVVPPRPLPLAICEPMKPFLPATT